MYESQLFLVQQRGNNKKFHDTHAVGDTLLRDISLSMYFVLNVFCPPPKLHRQWYAAEQSVANSMGIRKHFFYYPVF